MIYKTKLFFTHSKNWKNLKFKQNREEQVSFTNNIGIN
jgi:hypothetical protein